jgi:hypothetical protein
VLNNELNVSDGKDWVKILALIAASGVEIYSGLGSNSRVTLIGDVTYRRHGWKIQYENRGKFADTV